MGAGVLAAALVGCVPTTLAPSIIRMSPLALDATQSTFGVRTGPRLAAPLTGLQTVVGGTRFVGDSNPFNPSQWGEAYDVSLAHALGSSGFVLHGGVQGEFTYPLPVPAFGVFLGASRLFTRGRFTVAPAFAVRGASDLALTFFQGSGTQAGAELSATIAWHGDDAGAIGFAPFATVVRQWTSRGVETDVFVGGVLIVQLDWQGVAYQLSGGAGRVLSPARPGWMVPLNGFTASP